MRKTWGGWGEKGVLFFFGLFHFRDVVQTTKYWQAQYMSSPPRVTCTWLGTPLTCQVLFLTLFQRTAPNPISRCHSILCKKLVSLCLSAQERLITNRSLVQFINVSSRFQSRALWLLFNLQVCVAGVEFTFSNWKCGHACRNWDCWM